MSLINKIKSYIAASRVPSSDVFRESLTPENALDKLVEYCDNKNVINAYKIKDSEKNLLEHLLNPFYFTASIIEEGKVLDLARYMNQSDLFAELGPIYYKGKVGNMIKSIMFPRCPPTDRPLLLSIMEGGSHMQGLIRCGELGAGNGPSFYYRLVTEAYTPDDAVLLLKNSPSFNEVKECKDFAWATLEGYPKYKGLL